MKFNSCSTIFLLNLFYPVTFFFSCTSKQNAVSKKPDFIVSASLSGSYIKDSVQMFFIAGKLHNTSSDTLSYLSMSCSWDELWKLSSPNLEIEKNICYLNVPIVIQLAPHESITNYLPVKLLKPYNEIKYEKFLIGFNLVKADPKLISQNEADSSFTIFEKQTAALENTRNVFWSDTVELNQIFEVNTIRKEE